jgi:hypothetical protein
MYYDIYVDPVAYCQLLFPISAQTVPLGREKGWKKDLSPR